MPRPPRRPPSHSAEMRYYQYLEKRDRKNIIYEDEVEKLKRKGDLSSLLFEGELNDDENAYIISGDEDAKADKNTSMLMKKIVFSVLCIAVSLLLNLAKFTIPNTPALIQTEFSAFPELAAALVVHPLVGCGIVLVKNLIYYFILPNTFPSILSKIILDFVFILSSCYIAKLFMKTKRNRVWLKNREEQSLPYRAYRLEPVIVSEIIASVLTAAASAFTLQYIILPLMYRFFGSYGYNYENVFKSYQLAYDALTKAMPFIKSVIPAMDSMRCGVILYNIPLTFVKYLICSLLAVITYYFINIIINKERR